MHKDLPQDVQLMLLGLCILGGLLLVALVRVFSLALSNRRMRLEIIRMEKQSLEQQARISTIHQDAMSWRTKMRQQFDALRSDLSRRLIHAEDDCQHAWGELENAQGEKLAAALARAAGQEARLAASLAPPAPQLATLPDISTAPRPANMHKARSIPLPALPAMETLRVQALENELSTARAEIAAGNRQNVALRQALLMARRKQHPATRKNNTRGPARPL